jgi:succinyl-CoA synthetase alpha subunit
MSILVDKNTKVITQGMTGATGTFHTEQALAYGTQMVGGVTPGKGGTSISACRTSTPSPKPRPRPARPRRDLCAAALRRRLDPRGDRRRDAADRHDHRRHSGARHGQGQARAFGLEVAPDRPELPRRADPRRVQDRHHARQHLLEGQVGVVSRSGTLTYEAVFQTTNAASARPPRSASAAIPVNGTNFIDVLELFLADEATKSIIMIGEIGGDAEEQAAQFLIDEAKRGRKKPMAGFIAGRTAPPGRRMGHAGAIVSGGKGDAESKIAAMEAAGIKVSASPSELGTTLPKC